MAGGKKAWRLTARFIDKGLGVKGLSTCVASPTSGLTANFASLIINRGSVMPLAEIRVVVSASYLFTSYETSLSLFGVPKGTFPQNLDVMLYNELQCMAVLCVGCVVVVVVDDAVVAVSTVCSGIVLCVGVFVCKSSALMILSWRSSVWLNYTLSLHQSNLLSGVMSYLAYSSRLLANVIHYVYGYQFKTDMFT